MSEPSGLHLTDAILSGHQPREALGEIIRFMRFLADDAAISIDEAVAASEQRTGFRNAALANYMKSFGVIENPHSIAFESMDQADFRQFWTDAVEVIKDQWLPRVGMETFEEIREMLSGPYGGKK